MSKSTDVEEQAARAPSVTERTFMSSVKPRTRLGSLISIEETSGHPTHAILTTTTASDDDADASTQNYRYLWNARDHRKTRYPLLLQSKSQQTAYDMGTLEEPVHRHPTSVWSRLRLVSWEPRNVTWHICWVGMIANTLWVVNGLYAVWPELAKSENGSVTIPYYTGAIGAFLFIVTGYLGYVEAINHTHDEVRTLGQISSDNRQTCNVPDQYGIRYHPLGLYPSSKDVILKAGFPVVQDEQTSNLITSQLFDRILEEHRGNVEVMEQHVKGRTLNIQLGNRSIQVKIHGIVRDESPSSSSLDKTVSSKYVWWSKHPDLHHLGVFNATIFFISTIIFWIPALAWWPMNALDHPTLASEIFLVYILQIIPSVGFIFVGHASMAEASGSWIIPEFHKCRWWIWVLLIPSTIPASSCWRTGMLSVLG